MPLTPNTCEERVIYKSSLVGFPFHLGIPVGNRLYRRTDITVPPLSFTMIVFWFQTPDIVHTVLSPTMFRAEFRRSSSTSMFNRNVKFQVDIIQSNEQENTFYVNFLLLSGTVQCSVYSCDINSGKKIFEGISCNWGLSVHNKRGDNWDFTQNLCWLT